MIKKITSLTAFISPIILAVNVSAQNMESQLVSVTVKDSEAIKKDTLVGKPSVTHHQMTVDGKIVTYTATAGYMPMKDKDDKLIA